MAQVAPTGRLVLIEGTWGKTSGVAAAQARARTLINRILRPEAHQHDDYPAHIVRTLPYAGGLRPAEAVRLVESSPWGSARFERLTNLERASVSDRGLLAELLGTVQRWAVTAGS
jgi:hypothetical protein